MYIFLLHWLMTHTPQYLPHTPTSLLTSADLGVPDKHACTSWVCLCSEYCFPQEQRVLLSLFCALRASLMHCLLLPPPLYTYILQKYMCIHVYCKYMYTSYVLFSLYNNYCIFLHYSSHTHTQALHGANQCCGIQSGQSAGIRTDSENKVEWSGEGMAC